MIDKQDTYGLIKELAFDSERRFEAADMLVSMGAQAVDPLARALKTENWCIRGNAAWALGTIGDPRAVEPLIDVLKDEVPEVRVSASGALVNIGEPAIEPLKGAAKKDPGIYRLVTCIIDRIHSKPMKTLTS
jgi:bilin biosynthesis protein